MPVVSTAAGQSRMRRTARSNEPSSAPAIARTAAASVSITCCANCRSESSIFARNRWILAALPLKSTAPHEPGMAQVEYRVDLPVYNGPLDLLLYLLKKDELDIYDIPISRITDSY